MDKAWLIVNLEEARQALDRAISEIRTLDIEDEPIAQQLVAEAYIKLNYAWHSRAGVSDSSGLGNHNEWIKYPKVMDTYTESDDGRSA